jgi:succinate-semialdehyde dehydrogenase/glutarate-semialdehyde dehydrogenase
MSTITQTASTQPIRLADSELLENRCLVGGEWIGASTGDSITICNPATGEPIGTVPSMGSEETRQAIETADAAWDEWRSQSGKHRANLLRTWFDLIMANQEDLAVLMTSEQGKPLTESRGEVAYAAPSITLYQGGALWFSSKQSVSAPQLPHGISRRQ